MSRALDALKILREGKHAPSDMAFLAGYSSVQSFRRACLLGCRLESASGWYATNPKAHVDLHMDYVLGRGPIMEGYKRKRLWTGRNWQWPVALYLRAFFNAGRR